MGVVGILPTLPSIEKCSTCLRDYLSAAYPKPWKNFSPWQSVSTVTCAEYFFFKGGFKLSLARSSL